MNVLMAVILVASMPQSATAAASINVGTVPLELGMPEDEVLELLGENNDLRRLHPEVDAWDVTDPDGEGLGGKQLGRLMFQDKALVSVSTARFALTAYGFAGELYEALAGFVSQNLVQCQLSSWEDAQARTITLRCSDKQIVIVLAADAKPDIKQAVITEQLVPDWVR